MLKRGNRFFFYFFFIADVVYDLLFSQLKYGYHSIFLILWLFVWEKQIFYLFNHLWFYALETQKMYLQIQYLCCNWMNIHIIFLHEEGAERFFLFLRHYVKWVMGTLKLTIYIFFYLANNVTLKNDKKNTKRWELECIGLCGGGGGFKNNIKWSRWEMKI